MDNNMISLRKNTSTASSSNTTDHKTDRQDIIRDYSIYESFKYKNPLRRYRNKQLCIEKILNPEEQLHITQERRANMIPAEILYSEGIKERKQKVYQHFSQESIFCCQPTEQIMMNFINKESQQRLIEQDYDNIHLGLIMIGVYGLHRKHYGSKVFISLIDNREENLEKAIIGQMEVDMSNNFQIIYLIPDFQMTVKDFANHIKLIIKTKGYENMTEGEANLKITKALVARIGNQIASNFKLEIPEVLTYLSSHGIKAIAGKKFSEKQLGTDWTITLPNKNKAKITHPTTADYWSHKDGSLTTSFSTYIPSPNTNQDSDDESTTILVTTTSEYEHSVVNNIEEEEEINFENIIDIPLFYETNNIEEYPMLMADAQSSRVPTSTVG